MLDLNFVRDNLPLVEEKLRQRGMDPAEVLEGFPLRSTPQRRQAITEAETMKAQRNRASEDIARLKKSGQDASALIAETKELREQIQAAARKPRRIRSPPADRFSPAFRTCRTRACRWARAPKTTSKSAAGARRRSSISRPSRTGNWASSWACSIWSARPN